MLEPPRVDPVGLSQVPAGFARRPRTYARPLRVAALATLVAFAVVATSTTVLTLGRYCLTSQAGIPLPSPPRVPLAPGSRR